MMQKIAGTFLLCLVTLFSFAQSDAADSAEMADVMRGNGKIYVVVAVILTIFIGIVLYLVRLDRKIGKLEKQTT